MPGRHPSPRGARRRRPRAPIRSTSSPSLKKKITSFASGRPPAFRARAVSSSAPTATALSVAPGPVGHRIVVRVEQDGFPPALGAGQAGEHVLHGRHRLAADRHRLLYLGLQPQSSELGDQVRLRLGVRRSADGVGSRGQRLDRGQCAFRGELIRRSALRQRSRRLDQEDRQRGQPQEEEKRTIPGRGLVRRSSGSGGRRGRIQSTLVFQPLLQLLFSSGAFSTCSGGGSADLFSGPPLPEGREELSGVGSLMRCPLTTRYASEAVGAVQRVVGLDRRLRRQLLGISVVKPQ